MSRRTKGGVSRRVSLLTSSSFIASVMLSSAGTLALLAPSTAMAVPAACTPTEGTYAAPNASPGGTIVCGPATTGSIGYTSNAVDTALTLDSGTVVNNGGVSLTSTGAQNLSVTVVTGGTGGSIDGTTPHQNGINVVSAGGNVAVNTGTAPFAITGAPYGVQATTSGAGTVTVLGSNAVTGGPTGSGIGVQGGSGAITIGQAGNAYAGAATGGHFGIVAVGSGAVSVYTSANATGGANYGIGAQSTGAGGNVIVSATGGTISGGIGGIGAETTNANSVTITTTDAITTTSGQGIGAQSNTGAINISSTGASITGGDDGIGAITGGAITINNSDTISGVGSAGIIAASGAGAINITNSGAISDAQVGIESINFGAGSAVVNSNGNISATSVGVAVVGGGDGRVNVGDNSSIDPDDYGVVVDVAGTAVVNTGAAVAITVDDGIVAGNDDRNYGVYASSGLNADAAAGSPSVQVALGTNNSITVTDSADGQADGGLGIAAINIGTGTGSVAVSAGNGLAISVTGNNAGGIGAATNFGGGSGSGNVSVTTGTGTISVVGGAATGDTANNFPRSFGIAATSNGGNVSITTAAAISVSNNVDAVSSNTTVGLLGQTNGAGNVSITQNTGASIVSSNGNGIQADAVDGAITIAQAGALTATNGNGIQATVTGSGSIGVTSTGAITATNDGALVRSTGNGSGTVSVALDGNVTAGQEGIHAFTNGTGSITASYGDLGGTQTLTATNGAGIHVVDINSAGSATVKVGKVGNTGTTTITAPVYGVQVFSRGNATVNLGDKVVIDPDNYGVFALSNGVTTVTSGANDSITVDDNVVAGNDDKNYGVYAASTANANGGPATPSVSVALGANNSITVKDSGADGQADGGLGIAAINTGSGTGGVSVSTGAGLNINVKGNNAGGIGASTVFGGGTGAGSVTVNVGTGAITVAGGANTGDTANNFPGSFGIAATTQGAGLISVTNGAAITVSNNAGVGNRVEGIDAVTTGTGNVTVANSGAISALGATGIGINAKGGNGVTVTTSGAVSGGANGVVVNSGHGNTVTVASTGSIRGLGSDLAHAALDVTTGTNAGDTANITNGGLIASNSATTALQAADVAIVLKGGNAIVVNAAGGTVNGHIDGTGLTTAGGSGATLSLTNAGTWNLAGTETLSPNNDAFLNSGTLNTLGTTTFAMGAGANTFTNSGTIVVGGVTAGSATASLTVSGITVLNNSGTIDLHDGANNRSLTTTAALNGSGNSLLYEDAFLGASGSPASSVTIGGSTGLTSIRINNTNTTGVGSYIPSAANGIVLVTGATALSNFQLSPLSTGANGPGLPTGATNAIAAPGLFFYDLAINGNQIVLVSAPKVEAFQFAQIGAIAGDTWYTTTQTWFDRQADLRDSLSGRADGSSPAVWMKIVGDWSRRNSASNLTVAGKTYGYDTSYRGDTAAIIAGVDLLHASNKDQAWVVGVQGGYVDANERFRTAGTTLNLTGGVVGVYASYLRGGLFVDGIINGNILTGGWNLPGLLGAGAAPWAASSHVNTWGGQAEAGYAFPIGAASFVEPLGSIAYGRTTTGGLTMPGGNLQSIGNADTLRGSLGARVGTTASMQYFKVKVALEARAWDEFDGKTNSVLANGGASFLNGNDISGAYGEVKGEANLFAVGNNLSAFVNSGVKWKNRYQDTTVTLGMRYQW